MKKFLPTAFKLIWIGVLLTISTLNSQDSEILVHLSTQNHLIPTFLAPISTAKEETNQSKFSQKYLKKINLILEFDVQYNGYNKLSSSPTLVSLWKSSLPLNNFDFKLWDQEGVALVVSPQLIGTDLSIVVYDILEKNVLKTSSIQLTGQLSEDRRAIHRLSDEIVFLQYESPGIASSRFVYTVRSYNPQDPSELGKSEVWEADYDGYNAIQLTAENSLCVTPVYIPNLHGKKTLIYVSYRSGLPKIYATFVGTSQNYPLISLPGNQFTPAIHVEKKLISFISDVAGYPDLFLQHFNDNYQLIGKPRQLFAPKKGAQASPTFSPDGKYIAFVSDKDGTARIYILPVPLSSQKPQKPVLISKKNRGNTSPAWSPNGQMIAYSAQTKGVRQIWIYDIKTKQEWQLTEGSINKENPTWAKNSLHLIFNTYSPHSTELYLINLNQREAVKISHGQGEKRFPSWKATD